MPTLRTHKSSPHALYFSTITVIEWIDIFTKPVYFDILIECLRFFQEKKGLRLHGYVIMTNHVHVIFRMVEEHPAEAFLRDFKKWTTRTIAKELQNESRRFIWNLLSRTLFKKRENSVQIWQPNNYSEMVESEDFFVQKLNYVHMNPVRKGYVSRPEEWKHSSARNWLKGDHSVIHVVTGECGS
jgi:REP element-mobilizing transposase RayT